jgi:hypothetical protein
MARPQRLLVSQEGLRFNTGKTRAYRSKFSWLISKLPTFSRPISLNIHFSIQLLAPRPSPLYLCVPCFRCAVGYSTTLLCCVFPAPAPLRVLGNKYTPKLHTRIYSLCYFVRTQFTSSLKWIIYFLGKISESLCEFWLFSTCRCHNYTMIRYKITQGKPVKIQRWIVSVLAFILSYRNLVSSLR